MISTPEDLSGMDRLWQYLEDVPYDVNPQQLYSASRLYGDIENFSFENCYDTRVYQYYLKVGKHTADELEIIARAMHDSCIDCCLAEKLQGYEPKKLVGVMGGHQLLRTDEMYKVVALLSKDLTERGSLMLTGGGPGAMEATHFGAWMAGRSNEEVYDALSILVKAPTFKDAGWLETAFEVMRKYPQTQYESLGIPTYLYGHEPSTPFATSIAKYFDNSVREDTVISLAFGGIIFSPGSAGTMQEIFQDAVQNHYLTFGHPSPMVFLGTEFWNKKLPVYPFLEQLVDNGNYKNLLLTLTDSPQEIVDVLMEYRSNDKYKFVGGSVTH